MGSTPQGPYGAPPSGQPLALQPGDFAPAVINQQVNFRKQWVQPPGRVYIAVDDLLVTGVIANFASPSIQATARLLLPDGSVKPIVLPLIGAAANVVKSVQTQLAEGFLMSAAINAVSTIAAGQYIYAWLALRRAGATVANDVETLCSGYLLQNVNMGWPEFIPQRLTDGPGVLRSFTPASPGAGVDVLATVPGNTRWSLNSFFAQLVTANAGLTRTVQFKVTDGTNTMLLIDPSNTQALATTRSYIGYAGGYSPASVITEIYFPFPPGMILGAGWVISTLTAAINAADQWSLVRFSLQEWADLI